MALRLRLWGMALGLSWAVACSPAPQMRESAPPSGWTLLSSAHSDLEPPSSAPSQTATLVLDVDQDKITDFVIGCRRGAPALVWYRSSSSGWKRHVIEAGELNIEAGGAYYDIDGDGDLDIVMGGDAASNGVWWWENPAPVFDPETPWRRREIKASGESKHHDQIFGDFDGDGRAELVFWNQRAHALFLAPIPEDPRQAEPWRLIPIYTYSPDREPPQRGSYPSFKQVNEHEGLAAADLDGDGKLDLVGGGRWFRHEGGTSFTPHLIDEGYSFTRVAVGQLLAGGPPEAVLVVGDGTGPLLWYEWREEGWVPHQVISSVVDGHSLQLVDINGDGHLDIFSAEMRIRGGNANARLRFFVGDGQGNFREELVATGYGYHEARVADLDGDGDLDILGKPHDWEVPRIDIWLNLTFGGTP